MDQMDDLHFSKKFIRRCYIGLAIVCILAGIGIGIRIIEYFMVRHDTEQLAVINVVAIRTKAGPSSDTVILPGNVQAWHEATIYARVNGYTINWLVDIGAHVKTGDLLAVIAAPEIDAQLRQTKADLITAEANNQLAQTTATRWKFLFKTKSVSKQDMDEKVSDADAKAAIVVSTRANRDRLQDLVNFERVIAPFSGIIMSRTTDIGRLINAGNNPTSPLFRIVQTNPLRVYVKIPQYYAVNLNKEVAADLYFSENPGSPYKATLLNNAQAIDASTRTLLAQFVLNNPDDKILPGSYTEAHLTLPNSGTHIHLPVNTLIFRAQGLQVAMIDAHHRVQLKSIMIGRDYGNEVEVVAGIKPSEMIMINPPDSLVNDQEVHIVSEYQPS